MFVIDDNFLTNVGYDVATLGAEEKEAIIADLTKEMDARITERFFSEVDDAQAEEVSDIQENPDRRAAALMSSIRITATDQISNKSLLYTAKTML